MKNLYLVAFAALLGTSINAQNVAEKAPLHGYIFEESANETNSFNHSSVVVENVIWYEDFANGLDGNNTSDSAWTTDGPDAIVWEHDTDGSSGQYWNDREPITSTSEGNGWMIFDCDGSNTPGVPATYENREGQLVSPMIDLSEYPNVSLSFEQYFRWCCYGEHDILVDVSNDGGETWATSYSVTGEYTTNQDAYTHTFLINITPAVGGQDSVKFRFNWAGEATASHYFWMLDDVKLIASPENALQLHEENFGGWFTTPTTEGWALDYTFIPLSQATNNPYKFEAILSNEGSLTQEDVILNANVLDEDLNPLFTGTSNPITINPLLFGDNPLIARDTFATTSYTPTATGDLVFEYFGSSADTFSNTNSTWSTVTEHEYGRDKDYSGSSKWYLTQAAGSLEVGNLFDVYADEDIYGIKAYINSNYSQAGPEVYGVIYEIDAASGDRIWLLQTPSVAITESNMGWVELILDNPAPLMAGTQYEICVGGMVSANQDTVALSTSGNSPGYTSHMYDIDGAFGDPGTWYYVNGTPMVRALMGENPNVSVSEESANSFEITPNPSNGIIDLESDNIVKLVIIKDALGRMVYQSKNLFSSIDLSHLEKGAYFVSIVEDNGKTKTKKLVIQ